MIVKETDETTTVLLCGVGGQGTILAADILARTAAKNGYDVKLSEIHGMAQRGGAVTTTVRFGQEVHTMLTDPGSADIVIAFEATEALRNISSLKEGGTLIVNDLDIDPLPVCVGITERPSHLRERLEEFGGFICNASEIAREAGNEKAANVALIGALSTSLDFSIDTWEEVIAERVPPKTKEINLKAFHSGRSARGQ